MARLSLKPAGSEQDDDELLPSDHDLGIGEADPVIAAASAQTQIADAMANPVIANAIEELVRKRVQELAATHTAAPAGVDIVAAMEILAQKMADAINRSTAATVEQMPGHVKPIPLDEVEARAAAFVEMTALIRNATSQTMACYDQGKIREAEQFSPLYLLRADCFLKAQVGSQLFLAGKTLRYFAAPSVEMEPKNEIAERISDAMWRYIGDERPPSAEEVAAHASTMGRPAMPGADVPQLQTVAGRLSRGDRFGAVEVDVPDVDVGPGRIVGTIVQEIKGGFGRGAVTVEAGGHYGA